MRQTLIRIPLDGPWSFGPLGEVPGFGFGLVLALWGIFGAVWLYRNRRELASTAGLAIPAATWIVVAAVIVMLPRFVQRSADAAIANADRVLTVNPHSVDALVEKAQAEFSKREYSKAASDLESAVGADPESGPALNRLAWMEATCPDPSVRDAKAAVTHAGKACDITLKRNPEYLATLAAARAEKGDYKQAVELQRTALNLIGRSDDPAATASIPRMREQLQTLERNQPLRDYTAGKNLPVFGFGAMLFLGFVAGAWTAGRRAVQIGISPEMMWDMGIWLFIAGVVGCRVFYCIQYGSRMFYNYDHGQAVLKSIPELLLAVVNLPDGGLVYYGGIPAGLLAAWWICRRRKISLLALGDVIIPSLFLGMAFGRIGCFLNGCCYGDRCTLPWGVTFPMGSVPDTSLVLRGLVGADQDLAMRLHPTQLYSSLDGLFLYLLTSAYFPYRAQRSGDRARRPHLSDHAVRGREPARDEAGQFHTSLTISQWISILTFIVGLVFAAWLARRPPLQLPRKVSTVA